MLLRRGLRTFAAIALVLASACGGGDESVPAPPVPDHRKLVFYDEFDGSELDTGRWATCYDWNEGGCTNEGNDELQWYVPDQVLAENDVLTLKAQRRAVQGSDGKSYPWVSGMISTGRDHWNARPRQTFTYGYFEAAIRIPSQSDMFPAFWLIPASRYTPPELDVMEFSGTTRRLSMYTHWRGEGGSPEKEKGSYGPIDFPDKYHVFALLWTPVKLVWYVDGVERFRVTEVERIPHVPMEVLINLAVGYPQPPPRNVESAEMKVDWVRIWQR